MNPRSLAGLYAIFRTLQPELKAWLTSDEVIALVGAIGKDLVLSSAQQIRIPILVLRLVTQDIAPESFKAEVAQALGVDLDIAEQAAKKIAESILAPVAQPLRFNGVDISLIGFDTPISATPAPMPAPMPIPVAPTPEPSPIPAPTPPPAPQPMPAPAPLPTAPIPIAPTPMPAPTPIPPSAPIPAPIPMPPGPIRVPLPPTATPKEAPRAVPPPPPAAPQKPFILHAEPKRAPAESAKPSFVFMPPASPKFAETKVAPKVIIERIVHYGTLTTPLNQSPKRTVRNEETVATPQSKWFS